MALRVRATQVKTVCSKSVPVPLVKQGPGAPAVAYVSCVLPDLGTFQRSPQKPLSLLLQATMKDKEGADVSTNEVRQHTHTRAHRVPLSCGARPIDFSRSLITAGRASAAVKPSC